MLAAWWAFIGGTVPFFPPLPARPISALSCAALFPVPPVFRRPPCPTLIRAFVRSQSPPGGAAGGTVRSCPTAPPRPISALACVALLPVPSVPALPCPPARSVLSFGLLSAAVGRRGFRSSCEASSHNARNLVGVSGVRRAPAEPLTADPPAGSLKVCRYFYGGRWPLLQAANAAPI